MGATYNINGVPVEWSGSKPPTAGDLKRQVGTTDGYVTTVEMPNGEQRQIQDNEPIPQGITEVSIFPGGRFGRKGW